MTARVNRRMQPYADALAAIAANGSALVGIQVIASSTTYTPAAGVAKVVVEVVGGGGAGGGATATSGTGYASCGAGGGAGGYSFRVISDPAASTVTIGAAGSGSSGATGGTGGTTTYADGTYTLSGGGGLGGQVLSSDNTLLQSWDGGDGGAGSGGNLHFRGEQGRRNFRYPSRAWGGAGASSKWGSGGRGTSGVGATSSIAGDNGSGYGSGGGGGVNTGSQSAVAGGDGAVGVVVIWEFAG